MVCPSYRRPSPSTSGELADCRAALAAISGTYVLDVSALALVGRHVRALAATVENR